MLKYQQLPTYQHKKQQRSYIYMIKFYKQTPPPKKKKKNPKKTHTQQKKEKKNL